MKKQSLTVFWFIPWLVMYTKPTVLKASNICFASTFTFGSFSPGVCSWSRFNALKSAMGILFNVELISNEHWNLKWEVRQLTFWALAPSCKEKPGSLFLCFVFFFFFDLSNFLHARWLILWRFYAQSRKFCQCLPVAISVCAKSSLRSWRDSWASERY